MTHTLGLIYLSASRGYDVMVTTGAVLSALLIYPLLTHSALIHDDVVPEVRLDAGTVVGTRNGSVDGFLGIPFAQSP